MRGTPTMASDRAGRRVLAAATTLVALCAPAGGAETRQVVAGRQYAASGTHRFFFGDDYRALWTTPVTVEVLDLAKEASGLSPVRRVGGQQTKGLALKGADGGNYTFRGIEKDASDLLDQDLRNTIVSKLLDDQMAAQHPGSELVARGLLEAVGVPVPAWKLVVMPDDPALGEFRKDFAGALGMFAEYPTARTDKHPGFHGATEIVDHLTLYKNLQGDPAQQVDVEALLRARLMDIFMGDWDRHRKQWRWARYPGSPLWSPIPEDRDQAFSRYEGVVLDLGRPRDPRLQAFGPKYPGISGLITNGREQDRQLLAALPRDAYENTAKALQAKLTDEAIEHAVKLLPAEWYALDGARLAAALRARRNALADMADRFYGRLADRVDVHLTDAPELVEAKREPNGDLRLTVAGLGPDGPAGAPYFQRVFHPQETDEVRLYAHGGNDKVVVTGGKGGIQLRMIGGPGDDVLDDSRGGGSRLSDAEGENRVVKGPGSSEDDRDYKAPPPPPRAPWIPPRDFGRQTMGVPWVSYGSDLGVFLGYGFNTKTYRFRKDPFGDSHTLRAGWSFGESTGRADYAGLYHRENDPSFYALGAYVSGIETLRFYGLGNETTNTGDDEFYKTKETQFHVFPSYNWLLGRGARLALGPVFRYSDSHENGTTLVGDTKPYGFGHFAEAGAHAALVVDTRDNPQYPRKGLLLAARGTLAPKVLDVEHTFGNLSANANAYLSAGQWATLAVRAGGNRVFGDYPFRDAAYLGGGGLSRGALEEPGHNLRGFETRRFGGDASLYGNADLRLRLARITLILPAHVGVFGLYDVGRVFVEGESSDTWHTSYGGGIWLSFFNYQTTFSGYVAHSIEGNRYRVDAGFSF